MLLKDIWLERVLLLQGAWWPVENGYIILPNPVILAQKFLVNLFFNTLYKIIRMLQSDTPKASAWLAVERCGDVVTACLAVVMVSGVYTLRGLPGNFRFNAEEVCRKLRIHNNMVFLFGTLPCQLTPKWVRNWRWAAITESPHWNRSPPQTHDAQYSRPCWQLKWQSLCYSKTRDSNLFCYYSAPGDQFKMDISFCRTLYNIF